MKRSTPVVAAIAAILALGGAALASGKPYSPAATSNTPFDATRELTRGGLGEKYRPAHSLGAARAFSNSTTYNDAVGDSGNAPDVKTIQISNDDHGTITFTVTFANRQTLQGQDLVNIVLDVDLGKEGGNPTGQDGVDYIYVHDATGWGLLKWNGSNYSAIQPFGTSTVLDGVLTFQAHLSDLGNPGLLGFSILTSSSGSSVEETAPDSLVPGGMSVYEVRVASGVTPTLKGALTVGPAKAGTLLNVTLVYTRSDMDAPTTGPLSGKKFTCKATVAGRALHPLVSASGGAVVRCGWRLPKTGKGKVVTGSVTVSFSSASWANVTKKFSTRIG